MPAMAKKKKSTRRAGTPPPAPNRKNLPAPSGILKQDKLFQVALKVWKASQGQELVIQDYRRKEALGWAVAAARLEGEMTATHGGSLADCLRSVIKELVAQLRFLGQGDGV